MRLHDDQLNDISARFQAEVTKGLSSDSNAAASVKMLPTHVRSTPDGSGSSYFCMGNDQCSNINIHKMYLILIYSFPAEKGQFLALDLGGSKFKVLQVKVREGMGIRKGGVEMEEKTYPIPEELLTGRGTEVGRGEQDHLSVCWSGPIPTSLCVFLFPSFSCLTMWQSL